MDRSSSPRVSTLRLVLAFAAIYLIWGTTFLAIRIGLETIPPFLMGAARFLIAGGLLYGWTRVRGTPGPERAYWRPAVIAGAFLFLGGQGGVVWSEQRIPSGLTAVLISTMPVWMLLINWLRPGGRRPSGTLLVGLVVGFVGVVILIGPWQAGTRDIDLVGVIVVLLSAVSWAIGSLYTRGAALAPSHFMATAMQMLAGGVLLAAVGTLGGEWGRLEVGAVSSASLLALLYLAIAGSVVAFTAYTWLLGVAQPSRVSTYAYVNPVVAVFLGWALADESLTPRTMLAAAIILAAVVLVTMGGGDTRSRRLVVDQGGETADWVSPGSADESS